MKNFIKKHRSIIGIGILVILPVLGLAQNYHYQDTIIKDNGDTLTGQVLKSNIKRRTLLLQPDGNVMEIRSNRINRIGYKSGVNVIIKDNINNLYGKTFDHLLSVDIASMFVYNTYEIHYEKFLGKRFSAGIGVLFPANIYSQNISYFKFDDVPIWNRSYFYYNYYWMENYVAFDVAELKYYYFRRPHFNAFTGTSFYTSYDKYIEGGYYYNIPYTTGTSDLWHYYMGINNGFMYHHSTGFFTEFSLKLGWKGVFNIDLTPRNPSFIFNLKIGYSFGKLLKK